MGWGMGSGIGWIGGGLIQLFKIHSLNVGERVKCLSSTAHHPVISPILAGLVAK
jgi:hypothetical protein